MPPGVVPVAIGTRARRPASRRLAVQLDTHLISYPELFVGAAAPLLGVPERELEERLENGPRVMWLAQRMERDTAEAVRSLAPDAGEIHPSRFLPDGRRLLATRRTVADTGMAAGRTARRELVIISPDGSVEPVGAQGTYGAVTDATSHAVPGAWSSRCSGRLHTSAGASWP